MRRHVDLMQVREYELHLRIERVDSFEQLPGTELRCVEIGPPQAGFGQAVEQRRSAQLPGCAHLAAKGPVEAIERAKRQVARAMFSASSFTAQRRSRAVCERQSLTSTAPP